MSAEKKYSDSEQDSSVPLDFEFHLHRATDIPKENPSVITESPTRLQTKGVDFVESFSATWERSIDPALSREEAVGFSTYHDRNLLITITTQEEGRWIFEGINPDIIACEIAERIRNSQFNLKISPLELLSIGIAIGQTFAQATNKEKL